MGNTNNRLTIPDMLHKLDELYDKEEKLNKEIKRLLILKQQLEEDIQMMEMSIMYKSNRNRRERSI